MLGDSYRSSLTEGTTQCQDADKGGRCLWVASILLVLLAAAWLRFYRLGVESFDLDEILVLKDLQLLSPLTLFRKYQHSPVLFVVAKTLSLIGLNEFILRFASATEGVLGVAAMFSYGRKYFGAWVGITAALMLAISRFHIQYSQQVRYYPLAVFLSILSWLFLQRALEKRRVLEWAIYVLVTLVSIYNHFVGTSVWAAQLVFVVFFLAHTLVRPRDNEDRKATIALCLQSIATSALILLLGPLGVYVFGASEYRAQIVAPLVTNLPSILAGWTAGRESSLTLGGDGVKFSWSLVQEVLLQFVPGIGPLLWISAMSFAVGVVFALCDKRFLPLMAALVWLMVPIAGWIIFDIGHFFRLRYLIVSQPPFLLMVSYGAVRSFQGARSLSRATWPGVSLVRLGLLVSLVASGTIYLVITLTSVADYYDTHNVDWRGAAEYIAKNAQPDDLIVVTPNQNTIWGVGAYLLTQRLDTRVKQLAYLPDATSKLSEVPAEKVWWVVFTFDEDLAKTIAMYGLEVERKTGLVLLHRTSEKLKTPLDALDDGVLITRDLLSSWDSVYGLSWRGTKLRPWLIPITIPFDRKEGYLPPARYFHYQSFIYISQARLLYAKGDLKEARESIQQAELALWRSIKSGSEPDVQQADFERLGELYSLVSDYEEAEKWHLDVVSQFPSDGWSYVLAGDFYQRFGRWDVAERYYLNALALEPLQPNYLAKVADLYLVQGATDKAKSILQNAVHKHPRSPRIYFSTIRALLCENRWAEAETLYQLGQRAIPYLWWPSLSVLEDQAEQCKENRERLTE
ncbi:MAG: glycosyltransferase family 39 protein [Candidatus Methanomethyliaceae archaeon]